MKAKTQLSRWWARFFALGLALQMSSAGLTAWAGQPAGPPQPADISVPAPSIGATDSVFSNPSPVLDYQTSPTDGNVPVRDYGPVDRVPNFFGDFVARPGQALVNLPGIAITPTATLTFRGTSSFYGVFGPTTNFAPFSSGGGTNNGIGGPGGPYPIVTDVLGFGIPPYPTSILSENAELTARIQLNFPGATFVSGVGNGTRIAFDYLATGTLTTPGVVAYANLPNPSGGGLVGRNKYFDDGSAIPRDRLFFDYNHIGSFNGLPTRVDVNRYVFGAEKTFGDGLGSVELRVPFAGTVNSDQVGGQPLDVNQGEFGNIGMLLKIALIGEIAVYATRTPKSRDTMRSCDDSKGRAMAG